MTGKEDNQRGVAPPTGSSSRLLHTLVSVFWCITWRIVNSGANALQPPFTLCHTTNLSRCALGGHHV